MFACALPSKGERIIIESEAVRQAGAPRRNLRKIPPTPIRGGEACFHKRRRNSVSFGNSIRSP